MSSDGIENTFHLMASEAVLSGFDLLSAELVDIVQPTRPLQIHIVEIWYFSCTMILLLNVRLPRSMTSSTHTTAAYS